MERLIKLLKANNKVSDYKIIENNTESYQLFYVSTRLETNRLSESSSYDCTVYFDEGDKRGEGSFSYSKHLTDKEVNNLIEEAIFNASLSLNPYFELPKNQTQNEKISSNLEGQDLSFVAKKVAEAVFSNEMTKELYSAATEIFINKVNTRLINSQGVDLNETKYLIEIELIPTCDTAKAEVEIYKMLKYNDLDFELIKKQVFDELQIVKDRHNAIKLPKGLDGINLIIQGEEVGEVFDYFVYDLDYSVKYQKANIFELNESVQGNNVTGTSLNIKMVPSIKGASRSRSFDNDGIVLKEIVLVENGIAKSRIGSNKFGYYLKEKPAGVLPITVVKEGTTTFEDMRKEPYIRCVKFSGLQMDIPSGMLGGEVRLGYYFDGEKEIPVTGFAFTSNMKNLKGSMIYSKEVQTHSRFHGPKYLLLKGTKLA